MQFDNVLPCVHSDFIMFQMSIAQLNTYYFSLICGVDCFCHKQVNHNPRVSHTQD